MAEINVTDAVAEGEKMAEAKTENLGLPWSLEGEHPWRIMCETNVPGIRNLVAMVAYRPMAEAIVASVNSRPLLYEALRLWIDKARFFAPDALEYDMAVTEARAALAAAEGGEG